MWFCLVEGPSFVMCRAEAGFWFENGLCRRLGDGNDTFFWSEDWHGKGKFMETFPGLYHISEQKNKKLAEMGFWTDAKWTWDLHWSTLVEGDNVQQLGFLAQIISSFTLLRGKKDSWVWIKEGDGRFSVKSAYETIAGSNPEMDSYIFQSLWRAWAPSNAAALGWRVLINRIQTKENLIRRNIPIANSSCPWCGLVEETTFHLLFQCSFAWKVWSLVMKWIGICLVLPGDTLCHFNQFVSCWTLAKKKGMAALWLAVVWHLWIGRNAVVFRGESLEAENIFEAAKSKAWNWLRARSRNFHHSIFEWFNEPLVCLCDI